MYCKQCGHILKSGAKFCPKCGAKRESSSENIESDSEVGKSKFIKKYLPLIIICATAVVIIAILFAFGIISPFETQKQEPPRITAQPTAGQPVPEETSTPSPGSNVEETADDSDVQHYISSARELLDDNEYEAAIQKLKSGLEITEYSSEIINTIFEVADEESETNSTGKREFEEEIGALGAESMSATIDIYEENRQPNPKDENSQHLTWDDSVFYTLEDLPHSTYNYSGQLKHFAVEKKHFINSENQSPVEYEVFINPSTDTVRKIISLEQFDNHVIITDYYYTEDGKPNFIFVRDDTSYTPDPAVISKAGERFYFNNDTMVKWRIVDGNGMTDYVIGENERQRGSEQATHVGYYQAVTEDIRAGYDGKEARMLNAAYNILNAVNSMQGTAIIVGKVTDKDDHPISSAKVKLYSEDYGAFVSEVITDGEGNYEFSIPSEKPLRFVIRILMAGCLPVEIYDIETNTQTVHVYADQAILAEATEQPTEISLVAVDAFNTTDTIYEDSYAPGLLRLGNANIKIREGANNRNGIVVSEVAADANGIVNVSLIPGCYTVEVTKDGYTTVYITIIIRHANDVIQLVSSPTLNSGTIRVVLRWGEEPFDLDSHLFSSIDNAQHFDHVWYGVMSDSQGNNLDVDDTDSYGPETVTINNLGDGLYKYYVADFTNCRSGNPTSYDMSRSSAVVSVFSDQGQIASFNVPQDTSGVIWEVFEIRNQQIIPIQRYYNNIDDKAWWQQDKYE